MGEVDEQTRQLMGRVAQDIAGAGSIRLLVIGDELGLFKDLAEHGPAGLDGIIPKANTKWKHKTSSWFAPTYLTTLPGQWAMKTFGLNVVNHLADHFFEATAKLQNKSFTKKKRRRKIKFRSQPIYYHSRKKLLEAGPTSHFSRTYDK